MGRHHHCNVALCLLLLQSFPWNKSNGRYRWNYFFYSPHSISFNIFTNTILFSDRALDIFNRTLLSNAFLSLFRWSTFPINHMVKFSSCYSRFFWQYSSDHILGYTKHLHYYYHGDSGAIWFFTTQHTAFAFSRWNDCNFIYWIRCFSGFVYNSSYTL